MKNDLRIYDTSSLLIIGESLFEKNEKFAVSSITFNELEKIKTASNKDPDVKYTARLLLHLFDKYPESYEVIIHKTYYEETIIQHGINITDDTRILSDAIYYNNEVRPDEIIFVTNDLALKHIANLFFGNDMIENVQEEQDNYTGYKEIDCNNEVLADFYSDETKNHFDLHIGEYLIIRDIDNKVVDMRVWTGSQHRHLKYQPFNSIWFGKIVPYNNDPYQKLLFDSLSNNKITLVKGRPGSGKSIVSLAFLMSRLDKGELDKIIVFCNTVATANSAKLGLIIG